jgi:hypothetical protein
MVAARLGCRPCAFCTPFASTPFARAPHCRPRPTQAAGAPPGDRAGALGPFKRKCVVLAVLETDPRTNATSAVGRLVIDLAEFACVDGQELQTLPVAVSKAAAAAAGGAPALALTVRCRWGKAGEDFTEDEAASMSTDQSGSSLHGGFLDFFTRRGGGGGGGRSVRTPAASEGGGARQGGGVGLMESIGEDGGGTPASAVARQRGGGDGSRRGSTQDELDPSDWAGAPEEAAAEEAAAPAQPSQASAAAVVGRGAGQAVSMLRVATPPGHSPSGSPSSARSGPPPRQTRVVIEVPPAVAAAAVAAVPRIGGQSPSAGGGARWGPAASPPGPPGWGVFSRYRSSGSHELPEPAASPPCPISANSRAGGAGSAGGGASSSSPELAPSSGSGSAVPVAPWPLLDSDRSPPAAAAPLAGAVVKAEVKAVVKGQDLKGHKGDEPRRFSAGGLWPRKAAAAAAPQQAAAAARGGRREPSSEGGGPLSPAAHVNVSPPRAA